MAICHHQPPFPTHHTSPFTTTNLSRHPLLRLPSSFRCNISLSATTILESEPEPEPVYTSVKSFAPATVANLGPGFDFLGCAVDGIGDYVTVKIDPQVNSGEVSITDITGAGNSKKLTKNPTWNCAGIAAIAVMKMLNIRSVGLSLSLEKGLPLGSGLGSSAASAAAAAVAVNELFGSKLPASELVLAGLESEAKVSGYHADNIAPAIMGGFAGAFGCTISGAGPTAVAVIDDEGKGMEIGEKMVEAFMVEGNLKAVAMVKKLDRIGARLVSSTSR
ncbi:hypothetical protein E3N88_18856 [Mikania micrantha]|uniref:GHMP kinase N-terminal domain-containing protein n=1 Tax=Mikania micrantha TaxID=192012 RepID=A0A5N6NN81_9ASTR|nr:hypothetical protein E3N88_18856 [Mikania micrantha]